MDSLLAQLQAIAKQPWFPALELGPESIQYMGQIMQSEDVPELVKLALIHQCMLSKNDPPASGTGWPAAVSEATRFFLNNAAPINDTACANTIAHVSNQCTLQYL